MTPEARKTTMLMDWQLENLRMLSDWQIKGMGLCPTTLTTLLLEKETI